jgi:hypothetical protein
VKVSDSGGVSGEFANPRREAESSLNIAQERCDDAGTDAQTAAMCQSVLQIPTAEIASCGGLSDDYVIELDEPLRAGQEYEFRFDFEVSGYGNWWLFAAQDRCVETAEYLYGGTYGLADVLTIPDNVVCQTFTKDVTVLNLMNTALPLGTTKLSNFSLCAGCPSGNRLAPLSP